MVIEIFRGDESLRQKIAEVLVHGNSLATNSVVICELFKGAFGRVNQREAVALVDEFVKRVLMLDFSVQASFLFGQKFVALSNKGMQPPERDLMIACICIANDATLVTRNPKDFAKISGLKLVVW